MVDAKGEGAPARTEAGGAAGVADLEDEVVGGLDRSDLSNLAVLLVVVVVLWLALTGATRYVWVSLPSLELPSLDELAEEPTPGPAPGTGSSPGSDVLDDLGSDEVDEGALDEPLVPGARAGLPRESLDPYPGLRVALDPVCSEPEAEERPCLEGMAFVRGCGGFCIDRFEASKGPAGLPLSRAGARPWTGVDWLEAKGACEMAGKRLCRDYEWMAACDLQGRRYGLVEEETDERYGCHTLCAPEGCENDPTGSHPGCRSQEGAYDMVGNVIEWTDALVPDDSWAGSSMYVGSILGQPKARFGDDYASLPSEGGAGNAFQRGGGRTDRPLDSSDAGCFYLAVNDPPTASWSNVGFRCCADAP